MPLARLRKVGGSVMVAIPRSILDEARIEEGSEIELTVDRDDGSIALRSTRPRYRLEDLLAEVDLNLEDGDETAAWLSGRPVGSEII